MVTVIKLGSYFLSGHEVHHCIPSLLLGFFVEKSVILMGLPLYMTCTYTLAASSILYLLCILNILL
jgi:hypothetical protein